MTKQLSQTHFENEFLAHLEPFAESVAAALKKIVAGPVPREVKILSFEIQSEWRCFPVTAFAMDDDGPDEVYFKRPYSGMLLPRSRALVAAGAIDQDKYEDQDIATFETGSELLAEWFAKIWHAVGGSKFPLPSYIHHHDRPRYFDLCKKIWVRDTDVWP